MTETSNSTKSSRRKKRLPTYLDDMEKIVAAGLALGYLDVGIIEVSNGGFTFTLRGPNFWRLTSGLPPYLRSPSTGLAAQAYLRIEALIAYLLLTEEAHITEASVAASATVWTIGSKWFRFRTLSRLIRDDTTTFRSRRAILMLMNLAIGLGLMFKKLPFVITAVGYDKFVNLRFYTSAAPLSRTRRRLPSKLTLPVLSAKLYWLGTVVGFLMMIQQARIEGFLLERGGLLGFSIGAKTFEFSVLPIVLQKMIDRVAPPDAPHSTADLPTDHGSEEPT